MDQGGVAYSEARSRLNTQPVGIRTVPCQSYPCTLNSSDGITHTGKRDTKQHLIRAAAGAGGGVTIANTCTALAPLGATEL